MEVTELVSRGHRIHLQRSQNSSPEVPELISGGHRNPLWRSQNLSPEVTYLLSEGHRTHLQRSQNSSLGVTELISGGHTAQHLYRWQSCISNCYFSKTAAMSHCGWHAEYIWPGKWSTTRITSPKQHTAHALGLDCQHCLHRSVLHSISISHEYRPRIHYYQHYHEYKLFLPEPVTIILNTEVHSM